MLQRSILVLLLLTGCVSTTARDTRRLLDRYEMYGFTGSVLVVQRGRVLVHDGYGAGITRDTLFDAGSIMKTLVAAAVVQLEERGQLRTSDRVTKYVALPADREAMTIEQLLQHTSGLPLDLKSGGQALLPAPAGNDGTGRSACPPPEVDFIGAIGCAPLTKPGEYSYSNAGYGLLALIVEQLTGQPFADYARAYLLQPAGMTESRFWTDAPPSNLATAYTGNSDDELEAAEPLVRNAPASRVWGNKYVFGAAGLLTTSGDLFKWWRFLDRNPKLRAFGWNVRDDRVYRGGLVRASYTSLVQWFRKPDAVLVFMMNKNTGWHEPLTKNVEKILAREPHVVPPAVVEDRQPCPSTVLHCSDRLISGESQEMLSTIWALDASQRTLAEKMNRQLADRGEVLGTGRHPSSKRNLQTFIRTPEGIIRVISDGEKVLGTGKGLPPSAMRRFHRIGESRYALYDPQVDAVVMLECGGASCTAALATTTSPE